MNLFKNSLRLVLATTSVFGFLGGWVVLAHSGKPAPTQSAQPAIAAPAPITLPTLAPLGDPSTNLQPLPALPPMNLQSMPRFRTAGS